MKPIVLNEYFWSKVQKRADGCWVWMAGVNTGGYGGYQQKMVHRLTYEALVGPIPQGLELDHLCRVKPCCNPDHLEPVTRRENALRYWAAKRLDAKLAALGVAMPTAAKAS
jgi:hypothetical protein